MTRLLFFVLLTCAAALACADAPDALAPEAVPKLAQNRPIINGTASTGLAYRAVAVLWTDRSHLCTGTLIAPNVILTAAHCFYTKNCDASGGNCQLETDASKVLATFGTAEDDPDGEHIRGSRIIIHPDYLHQTPYPNDIALLILASEAETATPFPHLPDREGLRWSEGDVGTAITVVGFGRTSAASTSSGGRRMRMETVVSLYCNPATSSAPLACYCAADSGLCYASSGRCTDENRFCLQAVENFSDSVILPSVICHTPNDAQQIICSGDSGGPSLLTRDGTTYVAGITSFSDLGCRYLGCSTDVSAYAAWIERTLNGELGVALPLGNICTQARQCTSGHCVDGVCCNEACADSACQACAMARGATLNGICTAIPGSCDDGDPCTLGDACAGGICTAGQPLTCATPPNGDCYEAAGSCQAQTGACHYAALDNGTPCDSGAGTCRDGLCHASGAADGDASTGPAAGTDGAPGGSSSASAEGPEVIRATSSGLDFLGCTAQPEAPSATALLLVAALAALFRHPRHSP